MADIKNLEGMIDSTPIMNDYADIESSKLPEYQIDSKIPEGPLAQKWTNYKAHQKLVNPANKRNLDIIVVGTGLAGASAASTLGELGFNVLNFCIQDSPRRAHSIAAQGGINAAKDYQNDGDSVYRLFYDTIKGGDFRSREANVYRLAEVSNNIIDQCVAQGVPFAREYGGLLANRSFGGAQVSRTFYAKGQTGQQLLLGAYASLNRQIKKGTVKSFNRREMLDLVIIDGRARGIIARNLITGQIERFSAHAVVVATGGYVNTFFLSTNAMASNGSAAWQCYKKGAYFANIAGVCAAMAVSFVVSAILLKTSKVKEEDDIEAAARRVQEMKAESKGASPLSAGDVTNDLSHVRKIIVACDAGMGSSAMGAGVLRKKIQDAGLSQISVTNSAINNLPPDVDLVITHRDLTERAMRQVPQAQHISLTNFLDSGLYTSLTERLVAAQRHTENEVKVKDSLKDSFDDSSANLFKLGAENIFLGRKAATKEEAIRFAGEQLVKGGYVEPEYVQAMLDREKLTPTYLGESIAVPHGTVEAKDRVLKTGVVFCQYPEGVRFGEEEDDIARLVIGIAARNNEHIQVITSLTNALDDESVIERLAHTTSVDEVLELLAGRK